MTDFGTNGALSRLSKVRSSPFCADRVTEHRGIPGQFSRMRARVRVKQQLVGVEAVASLGLVGAVNAKAIKRRGPYVRHVAVKYLVGSLWKLEAAGLAAALSVEETHFDPRRIR